MRKRRVGVWPCLAAAATAVGVLAGSAGAQLAVRGRQLVPDPAAPGAPGLSLPVGVYSIPGDTGRLFVLEQPGRIRIVDLTTNPPSLLPTPFLNISNDAGALNLTAAQNERGLLGLAFDPQYTTNGRFYIYYTSNQAGSIGNIRIERYTASGAPFASPAQAFAANTANTAAASRTMLLTFAHDFANHNGGALAFGPDGMLYAGSGDGGDRDDPNGRAQNLDNLQGKILRLDPNDASVADGDGVYVPDDNPFRGAGGAVRPYIWAYGMRNPWRLTFDRVTGDLWIADVGQDAREEIDFQPRYVPGAGGNAAQVAGRNYGWDCREGLIATPTPSSPVACDPNASGYTDPVKEYRHDFGACSVTGGYVYRGSAIPALEGSYVHADYCGNWLRTFRLSGLTVTSERDLTAQFAQGGTPIQAASAFGEDSAGELYFVSIGQGRLYKIIPDDQSCGCPCALTGNQGPIIEDSFETDRGWTASVGTPAPTDGGWQRGVPVNDAGNQYDPPGDADGSGQAFLTANRAGNSDVDGGRVVLTSPALDFSRGQITLCYSYYLYLTQAGGTDPDGLFVEISANGAAGPWVRVRSHTTSGGLSWRAEVITQAQLTAAGIANTANTRVRFVAYDNATGSIVEAGVDGFKVYTGNPFPDCNGNGIDDAQDISGGASADCNTNQVPDECDIASAVSAAIAAGDQSLRIDLDGGPVGRRAEGGAFFAACVGCHGATGTGGTGPNIRNKERTAIRDRLQLRVPHPGGAAPDATPQDFADLEAFLADGGSKGRPDDVIDGCQAAALTDCDADGTSDGRELHLGTQADLDYDGQPDPCECRCDLDGGGIDVADIFAFLALWFANDPRADFDGHGEVAVADIFSFLSCWFDGCG